MMYRLLFLLLIPFNIQAATVVITWDYTSTQEITAQNLTVLGESVSLGPQERSYTLLHQSAGDYTVELNVCNTLCSETVTSNYTVPDVPNINDLILNISVTKD